MNIKDIMTTTVRDMLEVKKKLVTDFAVGEKVMYRGRVCTIKRLVPYNNEVLVSNEINPELSTAVSIKLIQKIPGNIPDEW